MQASSARTTARRTAAAYRPNGRKSQSSESGDEASSASTSIFATSAASEDGSWQLLHAPSSPTDRHIRKRKGSIDKVNPFIGYFQLERLSPAQSLLSVPRSHPMESLHDCFEASSLRKSVSCASKLNSFPRYLELVDSSQEEIVDNELSIVPSVSSTADGAASSSRFQQDFDVLGSLGSGGQGRVLKVRSKVDGCLYAVKEVELDTALDVQIMREVKVMAALPAHANVVRYHTAWTEVHDNIQQDHAPASDEMSEDSFIHSNQSNVLQALDARPVTPKDSFNAFDFDDEPMNELTTVSEEPHHTPSRKRTLYIQMELCGVSNSLSHHDSFRSFVHRFASTEKQSSRLDVPSTLTTWLRTSVDARASGSREKHEEGLKLFLGVVRGVEHLHAHGVIHRDLKPDNIFLHNNLAKVGDFGLSKSLSSSIGVRSPVSSSYDDHTTALGTLTYASPEQLGHRIQRARGTAECVKSTKYSYKSDIFALGIILLELCCPFSTMMERSQVLTAVRHGFIAPEVAKTYPEEAYLIAQMTSVDPSERPNSAQVSEAIRRLLRGPEMTVLDDLRDVHKRMVLAVRQLKGGNTAQIRSRLESLVAELNESIGQVETSTM